MNETIKAIKGRRSVRSFNTRQILDNDIEDILMAGTYAPSAFNNQPWKFTVIQDKKFLDQISEICVDVMLKSGNSILVEAASQPNFNCFYNAPTVVIVSIDKEVPCSIVDCALAVQNMSLAAHSLGLGSVFLGGFAAAFYEEKFIKDFLGKLNLPENYQPFFAVSLGYKTGETPEPPRKEDVINYIK